MVLTSTHLYCDGRIFCVTEGRITEESQFSIPLTGDFETKIRTELK